MAQMTGVWQRAIDRYRTYIRLEKHFSPNTVASYVRDVGEFANYVLLLFIESVGTSRHSKKG